MRSGDCRPKVIVVPACATARVVACSDEVRRADAKRSDATPNACDVHLVGLETQMLDNHQVTRASLDNAVERCVSKGTINEEVACIERERSNTIANAFVIPSARRQTELPTDVKIRRR
ncbi:MAG: hypothetical protein M4D80_09420 [Myxococcota bacterium]|nr:hypothetical protein [Deltaproteobacteria bacterium]MDQ3335372.1 hypothetical protein [Myxococcota bacterium]